MLLSSSNWLLDALLCLLMVASAVLITVYTASKAPSLHPNTTYTVYDAIALAPARFFLPARDADALPPAAAAAAVASSPTNSTAAEVEADSGSPDRWQMPAADQDIDALAQLLSGVADCVKLWSAYGLLQCLVLLLMLLRLVTSWSFQTRLGIITTTLLSSLPQIGHLLLVYLASLCMYAGMLSLVLGPRTDAADNYGSALYELLMGLLGGSDLILATMYPEGLAQTRAQAFAVGFIHYTREFLFIMILMQFFMATLGGVFVQVKAAAIQRVAAMQLQEGAGGSAPGGSLTPGGIPWDLSRHVLPEVVAAFRAVCFQPACLGGRNSSHRNARSDVQSSTIGSSQAESGGDLNMQNIEAVAESPYSKALVPVRGCTGICSSSSAQNVLSWLGGFIGMPVGSVQAPAGQYASAAMPVTDKVSKQGGPYSTIVYASLQSAGGRWAS